MAKWGEGDPRWLVEHRDDGKNVNGWHWEEKNKLEWSKTHLKDSLEGLASGSDDGPKATISSVKSVTGEAFISIRKGNKKLAVYDLKLELEWQWQCSSSDSDNTVKGKIEVSEFASAHDEDDYIFTVTVEGSSQQQQEAKKCAEGLREAIYQQLQQYAEALVQQ